MTTGRLEIWVRQTRGMIAELRDEERRIAQQREQLEAALAAVTSAHRTEGMRVTANGSGVVDRVERSPRKGGAVRALRSDSTHARTILAALLAYGEAVTLSEAVTIALTNAPEGTTAASLRSTLRRLVRQGHHVRWASDGTRIEVAPGVTQEMLDAVPSRNGA